jgi:hypothetical protein
MADISSTGIDPAALRAHQRKPSAGAIEFQDATGRHTTVELDELADDDRELAEKFGYKPVSPLRLYLELSPLNSPTTFHHSVHSLSRTSPTTSPTTVEPPHRN